MDILTIIVCTYKREKEIKRLVDSILSTCNKYNLNLVIFNNDKDKKLAFKGNDKVNITVFNEEKNTGKTYNTITYIKNFVKSEYVLTMDDKDWFTNKNSLDIIIDFLSKNKVDLLSLNLKYINQPRNIEKAPFPKKKFRTMKKYYFFDENWRFNQVCDRLWCFSKKYYQKFIIYDFYKESISIAGTCINRPYYKDKFDIINNDDPLVSREYKKINGNTWSKGKWSEENDTNSLLLEKYWFIFYNKGIINKLHQLYNFGSFYECKRKNNVAKVNRLNFYKISIIYYILKLIVIIIKKIA